MNSLSTLARTRVALIIGAFALSACGGGTPSPAPSTATAATTGPTVAATTPPATSAPTTAATAAPPATLDPGVDPSADLEIAAPYTFRLLDESIAEFMVSAMEEALGSMADIFQVGVREAAKDGQSAAFVVVMRFPDLPLGNKALLDGVAEGAAGAGGTVESRTIGGEEVRIVEAQGQAIVIMLVGNDLVMVIGGNKNAGVDVTTAIIEAN